MGAVVLDDDTLKPDAGPGPSRFAGWPPLCARLALAVLALLVIAAALVPIAAPEKAPSAGVPSVSANLALVADDASDPQASDKDIALYREASRRIAAGENYYAFILDEQRARDYPVNPGLAVRLPTLAWIEAQLGDVGTRIAGLALIAGILAAWWGKLGALRDGGGVDGRARRLTLALLFAGTAFLANPHYLPLHEVWAGGLVVLALGLHRTREGGGKPRWIGAVFAGLAAVLVRELALPFVLLMAADALWRRQWREAAAWSAVAAAFGVVLAWHLAQVSPQILASDPHAPSWFAARGLTGWLSNVVLSSNLHWLPDVLAGPLVVVMAFGWLGLPGRAGLTLFLLNLGYALAFAVAGRWDNFYWGAVVVPSLIAGLIFAPRALAGLIAAARAGRPEPAAMPN